MRRQAMRVSPSELRKLADDLEKEMIESCENFGLCYSPHKVMQVNIINMDVKSSDTWEIE